MPLAATTAHSIACETSECIIRRGCRQGGLICGADVHAHYATSVSSKYKVGNDQVYLETGIAGHIEKIVWPLRAWQDAFPAHVWRRGMFGVLLRQHRVLSS